MSPESERLEWTKWMKEVMLRRGKDSAEGRVDEK